MFANILVPLDGSRLATQAVPFAVALARAFDARISLLAAIEPMDERRGSPRPEAVEADERRIAMAAAYLKSVSAEMRAPDRTVSTAIRHGNPAEAILAYAEDAGCDLIAMSSHGRTGLERLRLGSVAQHVARHAAVPTLVVRPESDAPPPANAAAIAGVTVTLDGSALAEEALPLGAAIAHRMSLPLTLLRLIPTHIYLATAGWDGAYYYPATEEMERAEERDVASYLDGVAARMRGKGIQVNTVWQRSPSNEADEDLAACLARGPKGLAVVASHGRGGVLHWVLGSTAEYLIERGPCPILIVRAGHVREIEAEAAIGAGGTVATEADVSPGASHSTDAQSELWAPRDVAAELSHPHPHPIAPVRDA